MIPSHRRRVPLAALAALTILPLASGAVQAPAASAVLDDDAHRAAFDYLLGDWEFTGQRLEAGGKREFKGFWTATRTPDNRTLVDEYRVVGAKGETIYVTTTLRAFHPLEHRWSLVSIEPSGAFAEGKARKEGADMLVEQQFSGRELRFRYYDIGPDRFSWVGSGPDGKGGYTDFQWIEARRIGPPRPGVLAVPDATSEHK
jgi:hypothetical protein